MTKLQTEAERVWVQDNCPYCHDDDEWLTDSGGWKRLYISPNGVAEMWDFRGRIKIHYCPMCGRKLNDN